MKTLKLLSAFILGAMLLTSCVTEVIVEDDLYIEQPQPVVTLDDILNSYEIWYVDIERTQGNVGYYNIFGTEVDISHDIDGTYSLDVTQYANNQIRLYDSVSNTSYYLIGYQRNTFDYDKVFYDNIHYFLHEYETWEKVYTSEFGALNEFDNENYLQFLYYGSGDNFRSSEDVNISNIGDIYYDYTGYYGIEDVINNSYVKNLTLDYDYLGNEYFELTVINDSKIELLHPVSGTIYEFVGRGYLQFKSSKDGKPSQNDKKRMKKADFLKLKK